MSVTLESLVIDTDQSRDRRDGSGVQTLRPFIALKRLSVQSHILFGDRGDPLFITQDDGDDVGLDMMLLTEFLPMGLQQLQMSCWTDGQEDWEPQWGSLIALLLEKLMQAGLCALPERHHITVDHPARDQGFRGMAYNIALVYRWEDDKPERISYSNGQRNLSLGYTKQTDCEICV